MEVHAHTHTARKKFLPVGRQGHFISGVLPKAG